MGVVFPSGPVFSDVGKYSLVLDVGGTARHVSDSMDAHHHLDRRREGGKEGGREGRIRNLFSLGPWPIILRLTFDCESTNFTPFQEIERVMAGTFCMFSVDIYARQ